jgi:mono/diheme cytochrome c family protein
MISARMSRVAKVVLTLCALTVAAAAVAACGTEKISASRQNSALYQGAVLFNQRCSGCHTLSYAATHGSAAKVATKQINNGPNFNVRCERPLTRVLYAIENGGFSGAIMPQNIVVGQDAIDVAEFVSKYAGQQSPQVPGVVSCADQPMGSVPSLSAGGTSGASAAASQASQASSAGAPKPQSPAGAGSGGAGKPGKPAGPQTSLGSSSGGSGSGGQGGGGGRPSSAP